MGDLTAGFNDYGEFKATLGAELKANVEGFVRIGYLLKVARDTDILKESGHKNVAEFAAKEYGLTKDVVSRYIAINDRYSEDGYSDRLLAKFEGFGVSKLAEMLTLPDSIIDEITPTLTREEIKAIKAEIKAEEEISPIEIAIEAGAPENLKEERELSPDLRVWKAYFSGDNGKEKERFLNLDCAYYCNLVISDADVKEARTKFFDTFGGGIFWARVPGVGRIMIAVSEEADDKITFTNSRSGEKKTFTGKDVIEDIKDLVEGDGCVEDVFNDLFVTAPKEEPKVAPVQQAAEDIMPKPGSWTCDQPKTKNVQTGVNKSQGDADNEKECSKETVDNRNKGNEDREISESTERGGHETPAQGYKEEPEPESGRNGSGEEIESAEVAPVQPDDKSPRNDDVSPQNNDNKPKNDDKKPKQLGHLEVGDKIINLKDGTRGTMLGYCAGEYKISTENGMTLVSESSINWKKEEIADAEYREAEHTAAGQEEPTGSELKEIPDLAGRSVKIDNILNQMTDAYIDDPKISDATLRFLIDKARELIEKAEEIIKLRDELNREALGDTENESTEAADGDD